MATDTPGGDGTHGAQTGELVEPSPPAPPPVPVASGDTGDELAIHEQFEREDEAEVIAHVAVLQCPNCQSSFPAVNVVSAWEPKQSSQYVKCEECDGMGKVSTGSYVAQYATMDCPQCKGQGCIGNDALPTVPPDFVPVPNGDRPPQPWQGATWNPETGMWV